MFVYLLFNDLFVVLIGFCQRFIKLIQFGVYISQVAFYFAFIEIVFLRILRPELCAVAGNQCAPSQIKMFGNTCCMAETFLIAFSLSLLKLEMVLWSGTSSFINHISSMFRLHSFSNCLPERIRLR